MSADPDERFNETCPPATVTVIAVEFANGATEKYRPLSFEASDHVLTMHWPDHVTIVPFGQVFAIDISQQDGQP